MYKFACFAVILALGACSSASNPGSPGASSGGPGGSGNGGGPAGVDGGKSGDGGPGGGLDGGVTSSCAPADVKISPARTTTLHADGYAKNVAIADMNRDGKGDVVVLEGDGVEVFIGNGDGTFAPGVFYEDRVGNGDGFAVADFDGDGAPDVLVSSFGTQSVDESVDLLPNKGDGTLGLPKNSSTNSTNLLRLVAVDLNGDGKTDFAFDGQDNMGFVLNAGGGAFGPPSDAVEFRTSDALVDLNGDGAADAVAPDDAKVCVRMNNGSGTQFAAPVCYPSISLGISYTAAGDVNGDGKMDVIATYDGHGGTSAESNIGVHLGKGDGTFQDRTLAKLEQTFASIALVDMNNDKKADFVGYAAFSSAAIYVLASKGDGTFDSAPVTYPAGSTSGSATVPMAAGDLAGNGLRGLAVVNPAKGFDTLVATCKN